MPVHVAPNGFFVAGAPTSVTFSSGDAATSIVACTSTGSELDAVTVHVVVDPRWISAGVHDWARLICASPTFTATGTTTGIVPLRVDVKVS